MLTLFDLAKGLTSEMRLTDIADVIAKHLRRRVPCSACVFYVYDQATDELLAAHAVGDNVGFMAGVRLSLGERLSGWVAANRQTIRNSDAALDLGEAVRSITPRLRSCLSTPLTIDGDLVGVLTCSFCPAKITSARITSGLSRRLLSRCLPSILQWARFISPPEGSDPQHSHRTARSRAT